MIGLVQRVTRAHVDVGEERIASIDRGMLVLIGVEALDTAAGADRLLDRLLAYRIFPDDQGHMNLDLRTIGGGLLLVPQFTLAADTSQGNRPGFQTAAPPEAARALFERLLERARSLHQPVGAGRFGAEMQVGLVNDGPVTFNLRVPPGFL